MNKAEARICSSSSKIIMMTWALDFQILLNAQQIFWKTLCGLLKWNRSKRCDFCACQVDTPPPTHTPTFVQFSYKKPENEQKKAFKQDTRSQHTLQIFAREYWPPLHGFHTHGYTHTTSDAQASNAFLFVESL